MFGGLSSSSSSAGMFSGISSLRTKVDESIKSDLAAQSIGATRGAAEANVKKGGNEGGAGGNTLASTEANWNRTLDSVKPAVVAVKVTHLHPYNGDDAGVSRATGFIVADDLILTNHHVIGTGPMIVT